MNEVLRFGDARAADSAAQAARRPPRAMGQAFSRGARLKCPACGTGALFGRYLKVNDHCPDCGEALHHHRADDAPPYFTIVIVGHFIVGAVLSVEMAYAPPLWLHMALWVPLTILASLLLLPVVKGALVGYQWALYMHGFDPDHQDEYAQAPPPRPGDGRG